MDYEKLLRKRADALMCRVGSVQLADVVALGDSDYLPKAARLLDTWFSRGLTIGEHVQAREVAQGLGIDLMEFDEAQCAKEKNHE